MDDNTKSTSEEINKNLDVPPGGDTESPPVPPMLDDTPPPPPLAPEEVKTPTMPLPKNEEEVSIPIPDDNEEKIVPTPPMFPTNDPLPMPDFNQSIPTEAQPGTDVPIEKNDKEMAQPEKDLVKPVSDKVVEPEIETPIAAPKKEEMPVEAKFPGQPLPEEAQQNLEDKAKEMIDKDGGVKNRKVEVVGKPKGNVKKTLVGMLLFVLLGGGAFAGMKLMGNTTENRSQAGSSDVNNFCYCGGKSEICTGVNGRIWCVPIGYERKTGELIKKDNNGRTNCTKTFEDCSGGESTRYKCCDGTTQQSNSGSAAACKGRGGYDDPNKKNDCGETKVTQCTCESWTNACGVNCKFPSGTGYDGQKKADSLCKPVIAMCDPSNGKVTYQVFDKDQKCWGEADICKNPVYQPNCKENPKACNEACTEGKCGDGMVCDTTSNTCRNPICADSVNCVCPEGDIICNDLTCSSGDLKLGNSYTFTCSAQVTGNKKVEDIQLYEFQYQRNTEGWINLPLSAVDSNVSSELFIEDPGNYVVQCRVCEDKNDKTKCTPYQITAAN